MKTDIISTRLPIDQINEIDRICYQSKISRTEWLQEQINKAIVYDKIKEILSQQRGSRPRFELETDTDSLVKSIKGLCVL